MGARGLAQVFAQTEALAAHAEHECRWRILAGDLPIDSQHGLRSERVGTVARERRRGRDSVKGERRGRPRARIDDEHESAMGEVERVLDLQLEVLEQLEVGATVAACHPVGEPVEQQRAERVVAAAAIADGDDENRGVTRTRGAAFGRLATGCLAVSG